VAWQGQEADRRVVATASILVDHADDGYDYQYAAAEAGDPTAAKPVDFAVIPGEARLIGDGLDVEGAAAADLAFWMRCRSSPTPRSRNRSSPTSRTGR
jgi:acyl-CoA thioesterase-2